MKTFTRFSIAVLLAMAAVFNASAGVPPSWNYIVSSPASCPPVDMTGAITIGTGGEDLSYSTAWPFTFYAYNDMYTTSNLLYMNSNGFIRFDGFISGAWTVSSAGIPTNASNYGQFLSYGGNTNGALTGNILSKVTGTIPNRVWTLQFKYYTDFYYYGLNSYHADIQVSFYETSNDIRVKYFNTGGQYTMAQHLGMNAGDGTYGSNIGNFPTNDTCFLFTPAAPVIIQNPQSFTATASGATQITLDFLKNAANENVMIAFNTTNNFANPVNGVTYGVGTQIVSGQGTILYNGGTSPYLHTGLTPGVTYYYKVWSKNSGNLYSPGLTANATTPAVPNPTSFTATAAGQNQINLSWLLNASNEPVLVAFNTTNNFAQPNNGTTYLVGNQISPGQGTILYIGTNTSFAHTPLNPNTTYYYKVWSVATGAYYSSGVISNATTTSVQDVSAFTASAAGVSQINLSWTKNLANNDVIVAFNSTNTFATPANGTNYNLGTEIAAGQGTVIVNGPNSSYNHINLQPGTTYYYKVWSRTSGYVYSSGVIANATTTTINNPQFFTATAANQSSIELDWQRNVANNNVMIAWNSTNTFANPTQGTGYVVGNQISPGQGTVLYIGPLEEFNHTPLNPSTQYFYKAWSVATGNYYSSGITASATTPAVANPQSFTAAEAGPEQINLAYTLNTLGNDVMIAWNSTNTFGTPSNGQNYNPGVGIPGGGTVLFVGNAPLTYNHTGRTAGTTYYYKVWSKATGAVYSTGITANATTLLVNPPQSATATAASSSQIDLSWVKNLQSNDVIIAWNLTGVFSDPIQGTAYSAGSPLGAATILYTGNALNFSHPGLSASTTYHYKVWSRTAANFYSTGITANATTTSGAVADPQAFTASALSPAQIILNWTKNAANNNVIIAWNTTNTFGTPANGNVYVNGDPLPGGQGTIMYNGAATIASHNALISGTTYYYKIFSYNGTLIYSTGITANATTLSVDNPQSFSATTISGTQIDLAWAKNLALNNVMLVFNTVDNFATPIGGVPYIVGNQIAAGQGTVIYNGSLLAFSHGLLTPGTKYYYKLFSVDGSNYYSPGLKDSATTLAAGISVFPYVQNFETVIPIGGTNPQCNGTYFLNIDWYNITGPDQIDWIPRTGTTPTTNTGPSGDHTTGSGVYMYLEPLGVSNCFNMAAHLMSPVFNFALVSNPVLEFWFHRYGSQMGPMTVQVSTNGGASWSSSLPITYSGNTFAALTGQQQTGSTQPWIKATVDLSAYGNQTNITIRIVGVTGNNLSDMAIDDIRVYSSAPMTYSAATSSQTSEPVFADEPGQNIMQVKIDMNGDINPLTAGVFTFSTTGTTSVADIDSARLFYTGNTAVFDTLTKVGNTVTNPSGVFQIAANQSLMEGSNYFWLAYDIDTLATLGNFADATVNSVVIDGVTRTPTVTAPPEMKMIVGKVIVGTGTSNNLYYPLMGYTYHVVSEMIYLQSELGTAKNILKLGFEKGAFQGTNFDSIRNIQVYMKHETATSTSTGAWSTAGYSLVYTGNWPNNKLTGWMEVNLTSPFTYNGTDNLSVLVVQTPGIIISPYPYWNYTANTPNKFRANYGTSTAPTSLTASANRPNIRFLYNSPTVMQYVSSTTIQPNTSYALLGSTNQEVIAVQINTINSINPLEASSFTFNTTGTTNTADLTAARVYFTGTNPTFSTIGATQFGSTVNNPSGSFTVTGSQPLQQGNNYFWLVYDISPAATLNNYIDAQCTDVLVDGISRTLAVTNPAGNRQIRPYLLIGTQTTTSLSIPMHYTAHSASEFIYLQSEMGAAKDLYKIAFYKSSGMNIYENIQNVKIYLKNAAASTMSSGSYSLADYTLVYSGPFPNNETTGWMEVPFTSGFFYNGTSNLHVLVVKDVSANMTNFPYWAVRTVSPNRTRTYFNWSNPSTNLNTSNQLPLVRFEYGLPVPMAFNSATTTQKDTSDLLPGSVNQQIIGLEIDATGSLSPLSVSTINFNTNGTTNPSSITNAKVWYTGATPTFSAINQFGSNVTSPSGNFSVNGTQSLINGVNYFWLSYDVSATATVGTHLDAECTGFTLGGVPRIPTVTAPQGKRTISGPLNGIYTVGTGQDYPTVIAATQALTSFGVSGPVTFRIIPGTYTGQITIPAAVGVSAANPVVYESFNGDSTSVIITYAPASTSDNYTLRFQGASYITFKQLTLRSTGAQYAFVVSALAGSSNISIENCRILSTTATTTTTAAGVYVNENNVNNFSLKNNVVNTTGYYGIYFRAVGALQSQNLLIEGNNISCNYYCTYVFNILNPTITANRMQVLTNTFTYLNYIASSQNAVITKNLINMNAGSGNYGIYLSNMTNTSTTQTLIANNFIYQTGGTTTTYGIFATNCAKTYIYHNSISTTTGNPSQSRAIYFSNCSNTDMRNNILGAMGGGACLYVNGLSSLTTSNYNLFYTTGSVLGYVGSSQYANLTTWKSATGKDANSISLNPGFVSNTDLHISNMSFKGAGTAMPLVPDDIDGELRSPVTPDIGADEFAPERDLWVMSITEPLASACAGNLPVKAMIKNKGTQTITSFVATWRVNAAFQPAYAWFGNLLPDSTIEVTVGNFNFISGNYTLNVQTMNPNNLSDQYTPNDTASKAVSITGLPTAMANAASICAGQTYTVSGATATNYSSLNWTTAGSGSFTGNGTLTPTYTPSNAEITAGQVILTLTATGFSGCGVVADTMLLKINSAPLVSFSGLAPTYCPNSPAVTLTGNPTGGSFAGPGMSGNTFTPSVAGPGNHSIIYSYTNAFGCSGTDNQSTIVHPNVAVNISGLAAGYCANSAPVTLTLSPAGGVLSGPGITGNVFNPATAGLGTKTITYTYTAPTGCIFTDIKTTQVNALPLASFSGLAATYCSNNSPVTLTGSPVGGTFSGNGISGNTFTPATAGAGVHAITYTYSDAFGCSDDSTRLVTVYAVPVASFTGLAATYCSDEPIATLNGTPGGGVFSGPGISGSTFNPATAGLGTKAISYDVITADGCTATTVQSTVVNQTPVANAGPDIPNHPYGTTATLSVTPTGAGYSYQWAPLASIASGATTSSITTVSITSAILFSVTVTNLNGGCSSVDQVLVTPFGGPLSANATATPDTICSGDSTQIQALAAGGTGSFSYNWASNPPGFSSTIANPKVAPTVSTTYTVTVTSGAQNINSTVAVTVNPTPAVSFSGLSPAYCADAPAVTLTGTPAGGTFSGTGVVGNTFNPSLAGAGTHPVTYFYTTPQGCSNQQTTPTLVNALPVANAGLSQTISNGASTTLNGSVVGTGTFNYSWQPAASLVNANVQNPTTTTLSVTTRFILTVTNLTTGCQDTAHTWVYISGGPLSSTVVALQDSICQGTSTQITVLPGGGSGTYTYSWSSSPAGFSSTVASPIVQPTITTTYTVTVNDGATNSVSSKAIVVRPVPTATITGLAANYCTNESTVTLIGSPAGGVFSGPGISGITFNPATAGAGSHTITYTFVTAEGCTTATSQGVVVNTAPVANAGPDITNHPYNTSVTLNVTPTGAAYSYLWAPAASVASGISSSTMTSVAITATTIFSVTVTTTANGCFSTDEVTVVPDGPLTANASATPGVICVGETTQLNALASGGTGGFTYTWASNPSGFTSIIANPVASPTVTTTYTVTVNSGAQFIVSSAIVTVNPKPAVSFSGLAPSYCADAGEVTLIGTPLGGLFTGTGISSNKFYPAIAGPGTHNITYTFTSSQGCTNSSTVPTTVNAVPVANAGASQFISYGTPTSLSGSAMGGGSGTLAYSWQPASLLLNPNVQNPVTDTLYSTTQFILTVTNTTTGCSDTSHTWVYITGGPLSASIMALKDTICEGETTQLNAIASGGSGTYSFTWSSFPAGFTSSLPAPLVQPSTTTTYSVIISDGTNNTNASKVIVVHPVPAVSINGLAANYCSNAAPVTLTGTPSGGVFSGPGMSGNVFDPSTAGGGTHSISYSYITLQGCTTSTSQNVLVNTAPIANAGPDILNHIPGTPVTLSVTPIGANLAYVWAPAAMIASGINSSTMTSQNITSNTVFSVTVTNTVNNCSSNDQVTVSLGGLLTANATANPAAVCIGDQVQLNANPTGGTGVYTFAWSSNPSGFASTSQNPMVTPSITTTYTVFVTSGVDNAASSIVVTVNPVPIVNIIGLQSGYCISGSPATLTGTPLGGTFSGPGVSGNTFNPQLAGIGTHNITYNYTSPAGCSNSATQPVSVYAAPNAITAGNQLVSIVPNPNPVATLNSSASGGSGNYTYTWYPASLLVNPNVQNPTTQPLTSSTLFVVQVTDIVSGCSDTAHLWVWLTGGNLSAAAFSLDDTLCQGATTQLLAMPTGGTPPYSYAWSSAPSGFSSTLASPIVQPTFTTTYTVTITDGSTFATSTVKVVVLPLPVVSFSGLAATYCSSDAADTLTGTPAGGVYSGTGISGNTFNPQLAGPGNHIIQYSYTSPDGCMAMDVRSVTVNPAPMANAGSDIILNCGGAGQAVGSPSVSGMSYSWFPVTGLSDPQISNPVATPYITTLYTLMVTNTVNGCTAEDLVLVTVTGTPTITLSNDTSICGGGTVVLTAGGGTLYTWSTGATTPSISVSPTITTSYVVTVSDGVCATSDTVTVSIGVPFVDLGQDIALFSSQSVVLDAGPGMAAYLWSTGATTQTLFVDTALIGLGSSTISVTVTDLIGCQASDAITISYVGVGIADNSDEVGITLRPNPSDGIIELSVFGAGVRSFGLNVVSVTGQVVLSEELPAGITHSKDLGFLPRGVYMIRITTEQGIFTRKLVLR